MSNQNQKRSVVLQLLVCLVFFNCITIPVILIWRHFSGKEENPRCNTTSISEKLLGNPFPKNEFMNINGTNGEYFGKDTTALVSFIHSKCDACLIQIATLSGKNPTLKGKQLKMFLISGETPEVLTEFIKHNKIEIPVLIDNQKRLIEDLGISCTPTNILVEDGIVKEVEVGGIDFKDWKVE